MLEKMLFSNILTFNLQIDHHPSRIYLHKPHFHLLDLYCNDMSYTSSHNVNHPYTLSNCISYN